MNHYIWIVPTGISVEKCSAKACTFQFHPMYKSINYQAYAMKVKFTEKGEKRLKTNYIHILDRFSIRFLRDEFYI